MADEEQTTKTEGSAKDFLSRLADRSEEAIGRVGELPGAGRVMETLNGFRERLDDMQRRMRGIESLDRRVADLEARLDRFEGGRASRSDEPAKEPASAGAARADRARRKSADEPPA
jgi:hypothetical protein